MYIKSIILLIIIFNTGICRADKYQVGPNKPFVSPNALYLANVLNDYDTIEINPGLYAGNAALAVWQNNYLVIRGAGTRPHLFADGQYIWGKAIWVLAGNNITVDNIEFSGAAVPDHNGAGIRLDGNGMTIRNCYFHDNENGILTSNPYEGDIIIEHSEFHHNGYGDGYSHNVYIGHVNSLTFRFNYSHHAIVGHNLKSRATHNFILYNRIMDEETGNSSRLIDLPNGGMTIIMGNLLMQGVNAVNNNLIGYGLEGLSNTPPHSLYCINNTMVNKRLASCIFLSLETGTTQSEIMNNIFAGTGTISTTVLTGFAGNIADTSVMNMGFVNESLFDYHLISGSPAIDAGIALNPVNGFSLTPDSCYEHPAGYCLRTITNNCIDAGAYEYQPNASIAVKKVSDFNIYPNPGDGIVRVQNHSGKPFLCKVYELTGKQITVAHSPETMDLSYLQPGLYLIRIITEKKSETYKIVLQDK
ncbi:MAG: T9SS type A sorting domain-containing protein [Bacteroidales bacterium]